MSPTSTDPITTTPELSLFRAPAVPTPEGTPAWDAEQPMPQWKPLRLEWHAGRRPSALTLRHVGGAGPGQAEPVAPEDVELAAGDRILLRDSEGAEWFRGCVAADRLRIQASPHDQHRSAVAYGPELLLAARAVSGQWNKTPAADDAELAGGVPDGGFIADHVVRTNLPVILNEGGRPNASASIWDLAGEGDGGRVFEAPGRVAYYGSGGTPALEATYWTPAEALRSLVEVVDGYAVVSPATDWAAISAALAPAVLGEVNVEGLSLPEAIEALLAPSGFGFALEPWADATGRHRLEVFSLRNPATAMQPVLGADGTPAASVEGAAAEVRRIEFARDDRHVANAVAVLGDAQRIQRALLFDDAPATRDLHPAWDTAANDLAAWADAAGNIDPRRWSAVLAGQFAARHNAGGTEWSSRAAAFRAFAWNEDGALGRWIDTVPDVAATLGVPEASAACRRPRPPGATYVEGPDGATTLPPTVWLGIAGDDASWIPAPATIWNDRAGFTLDAPALVEMSPGGGRRAWCPFEAAPAAQQDAYGHLSYLQLLHNTLAALAGPKLRLKLLGAFELDAAVLGLADRRADSSWPFRVERVCRAPHRFRYHLALDDPGGDPPSEVTDAPAALAAAETLRDALDAQLGHGSIHLRHITRAYRVGDGVSGTSGRVVDLSLGPFGGAVPVIATVAWTFPDGARPGRTELLLDSPALQVTS